MALVTGIVVAWVADKRKRTLSASDSEIQTRAQFVTDLRGFIQELTKRAGELEDKLEDMRVREIEFTSKTRIEMEALDRRWRHLANNLVFYNQVLRKRLAKEGIEVPGFSGWQQFAEEGGDVRSEWLDNLVEGKPPGKDEQPVTC